MDETPTHPLPPQGPCGALRDRAVIIVDCQATGASPTHGSLLEIAWSVTSAAHISERIEQGRFEALAEPVYQALVTLPEGARLPRRISKITGIWPSDLRDAIEASEVATRFREAIEQALSAHGSLLVVVHYARFERPFLEQLLGDSWLEERGIDPIVCTHQIARRAMPGLPRRGMRALAGYFGHVLPETKRAGDHVQGTALIWSEIVDLLSSDEGIEHHPQLTAWLCTKPPKGKTARQFAIPPEVRLALPERPGVYRMLSRRDDVLYVGKATSLKQRVNSYFRGKRGEGERKLEMITQAFSLDVTQTETPLEASLLEADEIKRFEPPYNQLLRADQRAIWFVGDHAPYTPVSRATEPVGDRWLGPFSSATAPAALDGLDRALRDPIMVTDLFRRLEDAEVFREGVELWRAEQGLEPGQGIDVWDERWRALSARLWCQYLEAKRARREAQRALNEAIARGEIDREELFEEEDEEEEVEEWSWSPQAVAWGCHKIIRRFGRLARRGQWLQQLHGGTTLCWHDRDGAPRTLQIEQGRWLFDGDREPLEVRPQMDLVTYDRLSVLTAELRRLLREGRFESVTLDRDDVFDADRLTDRLTSV